VWKLVQSVEWRLSVLVFKLTLADNEIYFFPSTASFAIIN
jgi:hypothetical protein